MSEDDRNEAATDENTTGKVGDIRKTRGIRFPESEWKEVKRAALAHDKPDAEERRIGPGSGFDGAADRADVPLHPVPGDREA